MKVSIITPCYNAATFIQSTIQSIQQQTLTDWELLIIDDGSTDDSAQIVRYMQNNDSRIKLIQKENGGTASARKLGLVHAKGEYIQFLDADDQLDTDKLRRQIVYMESKELHVSYTDWCYISSDGQKESIAGLDCSLVRLLSIWGIFGTLPIHSFLYRRDFLEQNHIQFTTEIKEREDWDFHINVFANHPNIGRISGYCGAFYTKAPQGKTTGATLEKLRRGTLRFLLFEAQKQHGYKRLLLLLRLSIELYFLLLSTIKYRLWGQLKLLTIFKQSWFTIFELFVAILLSPIAIGIIIAYIFHTRLH